LSERVLIVTADDFGASNGINAGIIEAHERGIVTSTSVMVNGPAAAEAAVLPAQYPALGVGLHWDLDSGAGPPVDTGDRAAVRAELARQLAAFKELTGMPPTHLDSHHHIHREPQILPIAREFAAELCVPLRHEAPVTHIGGFYGQWEYGITDLSHIGVEFLIWLLRNEVGPGWTELGCHPGRVVGDFVSVYEREREVELATLTDPRVRREIDLLGIRLASPAEFEMARTSSNPSPGRGD
jgi:predicted glycoside hydrolase/deacetylase ChbG (UPF0249 family)